MRKTRPWCLVGVSAALVLVVLARRSRAAGPSSVAATAGPAAAEPAPGAAAGPGPEAATGDRAVWLDEVVVTATRHETLLSRTPGAVQVITRREIEELNPTSTGELLEYVTGATVETGTGSGQPKRSIIGLNGLPANYTLVLVDGVRLLSEHIHTGQNIELIPPQSIERIEIIRGAAAAQYGSDSIGGVVNIITRKCRDRLQVELNGAAGRYNTYEGGVAVLAPLADRARLSLFLNRDQSQGVPLKAPANRIGQMGYERTNLLARMDYDFSQDVQAFGWVNWVDTTMDWQGDEADGYLAGVAGGTTVRLTSRLDLFTQVAYSKWKAETSEEQNELLQPEVHFTWRIADAHALTAGLDLKHHKFTRSKAEGAPSQDTYGAFLQHEWRPVEPLMIMTALRYDYVEDIDSVVTPMLSVVWSPDLPLRLRGSIARGFHAPTPQELYEEGYGHGGRALRFGNPDLKPEYSTTYTLGLELFPGRPLEVMLLGYYSDIDDMIVPVFEGPWSVDPTKDVWRRTNIARARVWGGEVRARYWVSPNLRLEGGYSYADNRDEGTGRQLPYDPGSSAFLKTVARAPLAPDWTLSGFLGVRAVFGRSAWNWKPPAGAPPGDPSGLITKLKDYQKLEAGLALDYKDRYEVFVNVQNILGQDLEFLDDAFTVIDGEPTFTVGFRARW